MIKRFILACSLCVVLISMQSAFARGETSMLSKVNKPLLSVRIDHNGCAAIASINDVPIMADVPSELGGAMTIPINHWLANGKNTVSVKITPLEGARKIVEMGQKCEVTISLLARKNSEPKSADITISKIHYSSAADKIINSESNTIGSTAKGKYSSLNHFKASNNGDVMVGDIDISTIKGKYGAGIELTQTVTIPLHLPNWKWLSSDKIANNDQTKNELLSQYQEIWSALNTKTIENLREKLKERVKEYNEAFYKNGAFDVISSMSKYANNPDYTLIALAPKYEHLQIFGNRKLARLVIWDGSEVIFFNKKDGSMSENFDIIFRKEGDKWIITR